MSATGAVPAGTRLALDDAARARRVRQWLLGGVAAVLLLQFAPAGFELGAPLLWLLQLVMFAQLDMRRENQLVRAMASLLFGFALAWWTMTWRVVDFRGQLAMHSAWNPTGVPGCEVMALLGFPIGAIGGHGGGGWREFHHLPRDVVVHTANVLLLALPCWLLLGRVGVRTRRVGCWLAFAALPGAWLCGLWRALYWWD